MDNEIVQYYTLNIDKFKKNAQECDKIMDELNAKARNVNLGGAQSSLASSSRAAAKAQIEYNNTLQNGDLIIKKVENSSAALERELARLQKALNDLIISNSKYDQSTDGTIRKNQEAERQMSLLRQRISELNRVNKEYNDTAKQSNGIFGSLFSTIGRLIPFLSALWVVDKIQVFFGELVRVNREFELFQLKARTSFNGSKEAALQFYEQLKRIDIKSGFDLPEIEEGFIKMANRMSILSEKELLKVANIATSIGTQGAKSFTQVVEAILDAQVGQFKRLEELGVGVDATGQKIKFTFAGVTTEVEKSAGAITRYILSLEEMNNSQNISAEISETLEGKISTLSSTWNQFVVATGNSGLTNIFSSLITLADSLLRRFTTLLEYATQAKNLLQNTPISNVGGLGYISPSKKNTEIDLLNQKISEKRDLIGNELFSTQSKKIQAEITELVKKRDKLIEEQKRFESVSRSISTSLNLFVKNNSEVDFETVAQIGIDKLKAINDYIIQFRNQEKAFPQIKEFANYGQLIRIQSVIRQELNSRTALAKIEKEKADKESQKLANKSEREQNKLNANRQSFENKIRELADKIASEEEKIVDGSDLEESLRIKRDSAINDVANFESQLFYFYEKYKKGAKSLPEDVQNSLIKLRKLIAENYQVSKDELEGKLRDKALSLIDKTLQDQLQEIDRKFEKAISFATKSGDDSLLGRLIAAKMIGQFEVKREFALEEVKTSIDNQLRRAQEEINKRVDLITDNAKITQYNRGLAYAQAQFEIFKGAKEQIIAKFKDDPFFDDPKLQEFLRQLEDKMANTQDNIANKEDGGRGGFRGTTNLFDRAIAKALGLDKDFNISDIEASISAQKDKARKKAQQTVNAVKKAVNDIAREFSSGANSLLQGGIDSEQQKINESDKKLERLKTQLDKELELNKQGKASNVALVKQQIEEEEALRQKSIQRQRSYAEAQFAISQAMQAANIAVSISNIFATNSTIPFGIGVALAVAQVGAFLAAFVSAQQKIKSSIGKYEFGGEVDGKLHRDGGTIIEAEKGEFVVKRKSYDKNKKLVQAINSLDRQITLQDLHSFDLLPNKKEISLFHNFNRKDESHFREQNYLLGKILNALTNSKKVTSLAPGVIRIEDEHGNVTIERYKI